MKSQKSKVSGIITPPTPSYLKRGCRRRGRYFDGGMGGFTLIELVITMVLIGIVAFIVADAMTTGFKAYFVTDFRKEALDQARIALERMTREIRNVRSLADIGTANATQFCFVNTDGTRVSFLFSGTSIVRDEPAACPSAAVTPILSNNTTGSFAYLQTDGSTDPAPPSANTRRIRITMMSTISGENVTLQSEVWPRNL